MASHMDAARLEQFLVHILTPVYRLTEDDTIRDSQMGKVFPDFWLAGVAY
jgi:U3 small nucleolar RNA-associated protein 20